MKIRWRFVVLFLVLGVLVWLGHAWLQTVRSEDVAFVDNLFRSVSARDVGLRAGGGLLLLAIGILSAMLSGSRAEQDERAARTDQVRLGIRVVEAIDALGRRTDLDRADLLGRTVRILTQTRGYESAFIILVDDDRHPTMWTESGCGHQFEDMIDRLRGNQQIPCVGFALHQEPVVVTRNPDEDCFDCPLASRMRGRSAITVHVAAGTQMYGVLCITLSAGTRPDRDEQAIVRRAADALGRCIFRLAATERRADAERALRAQQEPFRNVFRGAHDAAALKDAGLVYQAVNPAFCRLVGKSEPSILGRTDLDLFDAAVAARFREFDLRVVETGEAQLHDEEFSGPLGRLRFNSARTPVLDNKDRCVGLLHVLRAPEPDADSEEHRRRLEELVTERSRMLDEIRTDLAGKKRLIDLGQAAGSIAHEIRNPLASIRNAAYFLRITAGRDMDEKPARHLAILEREIARADGIITGLLDYARGRPPQPERLDLAALLRDTVERADVPEGVDVTFSLPADLPPVHTDPHQMSEVFLNLITNACQAMNDVGRMTIVSARVGDSVRTSIADTGPGIPPDNLTRLFEPLFTTRAGGTGLGLSLCRGFVDANQGTISVRSRLGAGATFTVDLPISR